MNYYNAKIDENQKQLLEKLKVLFAKGHGTLTIHMRDGKITRHELTYTKIVGPEEADSPFAGLEPVQLD